MFFLFVPFLVCAALAQTPMPEPRRPSIRAVGEATVTSKPDQATIEIGVVTQGQTAQAAAAQNAAQTEAVLLQLRPLAGASGSLRTVNYSISPDYRYPREGGKPAITGYTANNTVQVTVSDMAIVGKLIDAATQSGANTIHRIQFSLKNGQAARAQALREAAQQAKANADAMAAALGVKTLRILAVEEGGPIRVQPVQEMAMMRASAQAAAPTPVEPGLLDVHATVTLTVEIAQ